MMKSPNESERVPGLHTILGAGGVIADELMRELVIRVDRVRLVQRHPSPPGPRMETRSANLLNDAQVHDAVAGSSVAYLVAGLPYRSNIWEVQWPIIMRNVIDACKTHQTRLVFLDNLYLYGQVNGMMTETTSVHLTCRKGEVRARLAQMLDAEMRAGSLHALIARAADFFGPGAVKTFVHPMIFELLREGKKAVWLANPDVPHSMTFTPDAGRALAVLGNTLEAYGQVWHLPVDPSDPTGRSFIYHVAACLGVQPDFRVLSPGMLRLAGWFNPYVKEMQEVLYQHMEPFVVDSRKFSDRFFPATPWRQGVEEIVKGMRLGTPPFT